jgi:biopolymer transport protein ExbD
MTMTPRERRAERKARGGTMVDMNLVSLIDVFTILIFFLLSSASGVEILTSTKAVKLPVSTSDTAPRDSVVLVVAGDDILVEGRRVASVAQVMASTDDLVAPLQSELAVQASRLAVKATTQATIDSKGRAITIMADKDIPYSLLRKLMATCARADFNDVQFAVRRKFDA